MRSLLLTTEVTTRTRLTGADALLIALKSGKAHGNRSHSRNFRRLTICLISRCSLSLEVSRASWLLNFWAVIFYAPTS